MAAINEDVSPEAVIITKTSHMLFEIMELTACYGKSTTYPVVDYLWELTERIEGPMKPILKSFTAAIHSMAVHFRVKEYNEQTFKDLISIIEKDLRDSRKKKLRIVKNTNS